jgi:3'(2'), 5'-bisphosphate nucleotidase
LPIELTELAELVRGLAERAGRAILAIEAADPDAVDRQTKSDGSLLTRADLASHRVLVDGLREGTPELPVLSEEGAEVPEATRVSWTRYWLLDPLDGTKEFVAKNGEFTVNVALIDAQDGIGTPTLGVVHVPRSGTTYVGIRGRGAMRHEAGTRASIAPVTPAGTVRVVASRSHGNAATDAFIEGLSHLHGSVEHSSSGSSIKLCRVAEGSAHFYPRVAPTMAWDTAAAHAVAEAAGAVVWRFGTRAPLRYDARALRNPPFLVAHGPDALLPEGYERQVEA